MELTGPTTTTNSEQEEEDKEDKKRKGIVLTCLFSWSTAGREDIQVDPRCVGKSRIYVMISCKHGWNGIDLTLFKVMVE